MLQNKKFIIAVMIGLLVVAAYNIRFFFFRETPVFVSTEERMPLDEVSGTSGEMDDEMIDMQEDDPVGLPKQSARVGLNTVNQEVIRLASLSELSRKGGPLRLKQNDRNPFARRGHTRRTRLKSIPGKKKNALAAPLISPDQIKMIYHFDETAYVLLLGKPRKTGEMVGEERLTAIRAHSILLERAGKTRELFMETRPETHRKGVTINYGP